MNTSPFATWEKFEESKEAMYAFADSPAIMGFLVAISTILFVYWLYTTVSLPASKEDQHVN